jgi:ectoine hydroxylase-related dioxygenase (phytanoyl-CoA dioxygenase family)
MMTNGLDAADQRFFAEHGWLVVRGAVAAERVAELERAIDEIFAASPLPRPGDVWERAGVSRLSPSLALHARDPAIGRRAADALGCARVQLLQDTLLVKQARVGGRVEWHQDHTYIGYLRPARAASVRLALTDCTVENGCLEVIDGSHQWGAIDSVRALSESRVVDVLGERAAAWAERIVPLELRPGDLSFHHCLTLHRSGENTSARARKTLITRLFDAACTLDAERLPPGAALHFPVDADQRLSEALFPVL